MLSIRWPSPFPFCEASSFCFPLPHPVWPTIFSFSARVVLFRLFVLQNRRTERKKDGKGRYRRLLKQELAEEQDSPAERGLRGQERRQGDTPGLPTATSSLCPEVTRLSRREGSAGGREQPVSDRKEQDARFLGREQRESSLQFRRLVLRIFPRLFSHTPRMNAEMPT